jgi:D-Tyr-tRNAtyr deacylase
MLKMSVEHTALCAKLTHEHKQQLQCSVVHVSCISCATTQTQALHSVAVQARDAYSALVDAVKAAYVPERVKDGVFGAMMKVKLENDGPVTFILDTADFLTGSAADSSTSLDEAA